MAIDANAGEAGSEASKVRTSTVVGGYFALTGRREVMSCAAKAAKALRFMTPARLSVYDTLLERLAQDLEDMAAELGPFIHEKHAMVRSRHVARHRHVAPADQPRIRDGMMGRATRAGRDPRRAVAGEAGDTVDTGGVEGFGQGENI
jgi:hypothetical protein